MAGIKAIFSTTNMPNETFDGALFQGLFEQQSKGKFKSRMLGHLNCNL